MYLNDEEGPVMNVLFWFPSTPSVDPNTGWVRSEQCKQLQYQQQLLSEKPATQPRRSDRPEAAPGEALCPAQQGWEETGQLLVHTTLHRGWWDNIK